MFYVRKLNLMILIIICIFFCIISETLAVENDSTQHKDISNDDTYKNREIQRASKKVYEDAIEFFDKGEYWKCSKKLFIIMDFYTEFDELDGVIYYMGECLYEEEMNDAALKMYKYIIKNYPNSKYTADALFGLEKASYKAEKYKSALSIYYRILKKENNKSVIDAARYFAGQCHFHLKNYDTAISIFRHVSSRSEYYDASLYTIALSYLKKKAVASSIETFRKLISLPIISGERREIVDNARLTLGFIYYEINMYEDAIDLFLDISKNHENYQDALLGLGWAYSKIGKFEKTIQPLQKLIDDFPASANAEEAYFLLGQAYIMTAEYDKAIAAYKTIVNLFANHIRNMTIMKKINNSLVQEENKVEKLKVQILIQESKLLTTLSLADDETDVPNYLGKEGKKIEEVREELINKLISERQNLIYMRNQIDKLQKLAERKERRKNWRGYAEYGISRVLFLKEMQNKAN